MLKYPIRHERVATTFKTYNIKELIPTVDLRSECPPVQNQLKIGSCTAHALLAAYQFNDPKFTGSRLFLYYNERFLDVDDAHMNDGLTLSQGVNALIKYGVCDENMWPYIDDGLKYRTKPSDQCYSDALLHQVLSANNVAHDLVSMKQCLLNNNPFVFGMMVYSSFESHQVIQSGIVPMPNTITEQFFGGHAVVCVGYDDHKKVFIVRNSWGTTWGDEGHFYLPYEYLTDPHLTTDLWEIIKIEITDIHHKKSDPTILKQHSITPIHTQVPHKNVVKHVINSTPPIPIHRPLPKSTSSSTASKIVHNLLPKSMPSTAPKIVHNLLPKSMPSTTPKIAHNLLPKSIPSTTSKTVNNNAVSTRSKPKHQLPGKQTNHNTAIENRFQILMKNKSQTSKSYTLTPTTTTISYQNMQIHNNNNNNINVNTISQANTTFANKKAHAHLVMQQGKKPNFHVVPKQQYAPPQQSTIFVSQSLTAKRQQYPNTSLPTPVNKNANVSSPKIGPQTVSIRRINTSLAKFMGPRKVYHIPRPVR
jgi:hypothetical protein